MSNEPFNQKNYNLRGLAQDQWILITPDENADPYKAVCPCGCRKAWKYCLPNLEDHEERFIQRYINEYGQQG